MANFSGLQLPSVSTPSLSVPKISSYLPQTRYNIPKATELVPRVFSPYTYVATVKKRHVENLGDVLLGGPQGTLQLQNTLDANGLGQFKNIPILNKLLGAQLLVKERTIEPLVEGNAKLALVNNLQSIGQDLDILANPIKSLMPWAGGGTGEDFLKSMGWVSGKYRQLYQWNTGSWILDIVGETLSDPITYVSLGASLAAKKGATVYADQLIQSIGQSYGEEVAKRIPRSKVIALINKYGTSLTDRQILDFVKAEADLSAASIKRHLLEIQEITSPEYKNLKQLLKTYNAISTGTNESKFMELLSQARFSDAYRYYASIKNLTSVVDKVQSAWTKALYAANPLLGAPVAVFKSETFRDFSKSILNNMMKTRDKVAAGDILKLRTATVVAEQKGMELFTGAYSNEDWFTPIQDVLNKHNLDYKELTHMYMDLVENLNPIDRADSALVNKRFLDKLLYTVPELRRFSTDALLENSEDFLTQMFNAVVQQAKAAKTIIDQSIALEKSTSKALVADVLGSKQINETIANTENNINDIIVEDNALFTYVDQLENNYKAGLEEYKALQNVDPRYIDEDELIALSNELATQEAELNTIRKLQQSSVNFTLNNLPERIDILNRILSKDTMDKVFAELNAIGITVNNMADVSKLYASYLNGDEKAIKELQKILGTALTDVYENTNISYNMYRTSVDETIKVMYNDSLNYANTEQDLVRNIYKYRMNKTELQTAINAQREIERQASYWVKVDSQIQELLNDWRGLVINGTDTNNIGTLYYALNEIFSYAGMDEQESPAYILAELFSRDKITRFSYIDGTLQDYIDDIKTVKDSIYHWISTVNNSDYKYAPEVALFLQDLNNIIKDIPTDIDYIAHLNKVIDEGNLYVGIISSLGRYHQMYTQLNAALAGDSAFKKAYDAFSDPTSPTRQSITRIVEFINNQPEGMAINKPFSKDLINLTGMIDGTNNFSNLGAELEKKIDALVNEYKDILDLSGLRKEYLKNLLLDTVINNGNKYLLDITPDQIIGEALRQLNYAPDNPITKQLAKDAAQLIEENHLAREITEVFTDEELEERLADLTDEITARLASFPNELEKVYKEALNNYYRAQNRIAFNGSAPLLYTLLGSPDRRFNAMATANELALNYQDLIEYCNRHANNLTADDIVNLKDVICMFAQEKVSNTYLKDVAAYKELNKIFSNAELARSEIIAKKFDESINKIMTRIFKEINNLNLQYSGAKELSQAWGPKLPIDAGKTRRLTHVVNYLTADNARQILTNMSGFTNNRDAMIALGDYGIGVKKVIDFSFNTDHHLYPELLKVSNDYTDVIQSVAYYIKRYEQVAAHSSEEYLDCLRKSLTEFFSTFNKSYGPLDPASYFFKSNPEDLLAWHKFCLRRYFDSAGAKEYTEIYNKYTSTLSTKFLKKDYVYNVMALTNALDNSLQAGFFTDSNMYEDLLAQFDFSEIGIDLDNLEVSNIVNDAVDLDLSRLPKSVDTINQYTTAIQHYIDEDITARRAIDPAERLIIDSTKTVGDYVTDENVLKDLARFNITPDMPINSKTVSTYLKCERLNTFQRFLLTLDPAQFHKFMLDNSLPIMFYSYEAAPLELFKMDPALLEAAGLRVQKIWNDENIYMITSLADGAVEDYVYTRTPYAIQELQEAYNKAFKTNAFYYNMQGLNIPIEYFTGDMIDVEVYKKLFNNSDIIEAVQKSYSNLDDLQLNNYFKKSALRPNYVIVGEPQAFNKVITKTGVAKSARLKSNGLVQSAKLGTLSSIKRVNARNKYLSLIFNDDFSFDGAFKDVFNHATDAEIKEFFGNKRWVATVLRENRRGEPWLYKVRVYDRASLDLAIKEGAVILPAQAYRNAVLSINDKMLTGKWWNLYNRVVAATYKTLYLTTPGFLMRNYLDSAIVKNGIATGGNLDDIWANFKYEYKAMKMLQEYDDIMAKAIEYARKQNGGTKFNRGIINKILESQPLEVQTRFKLVDSFISTPASAGLTRSLSDYLIDYNIKHTVSDSFPFEKWWNDRLARVPIVSIIRDANDTIEQTSRLGLFLNLLDNGNEYTDALAKVVNTHFDYELKRGGLELLDQIFWFSTFPVNNLLFYLNQDALLTNPIIKAQFDLMEQSYNNEDISWEDVKHSDYLTYNVLAGNLTYKSHLTGNRLVIKTGSSVMDFFNLIANPFGEVKDRVNPFLSVLFGIDEPSQLNPASAQVSNIGKIMQGKSYLPSVYAKLYKRNNTRVRKYNNRTTRVSSWNFRPRYPRKGKAFYPTNRAKAYSHRYYDKYFNSRPQQFHKWHPKFYTYEPMYKSFYVNKLLGRYKRIQKKVT